MDDILEQQQTQYPLKIRPRLNSSFNLNQNIFRLKYTNNLLSTSPRQLKTDLSLAIVIFFFF